MLFVMTLTRFESVIQLRRIVPLVLASFFVSSTASAGTWSVVGIEWYPDTAPGVGTDGGFISLDKTNRTVRYGINSSASAPFYDSFGWHVNVTKNPVVMGTFRWLLDWAPSYFGEAVPLSGVATITINGNARCVASAKQEMPGGTGTGTATLNDPYYLGLSAHAISGALGYSITDVQDHPNNGTQTITGAIGQPVLTNDGTRHYTLLMSINMQGSIQGQGVVQENGPSPRLAFVKGMGGGTILLDATLKITVVNGQSTP